jgi:hypothetical protein
MSAMKPTANLCGCMAASVCKTFGENSAPFGAAASLSHGTHCGL